MLGSPLSKGSLYFSRYTGTKAYMATTVMTTAHAILRAQQSATPAVVYGDGLPKSRLRWFGVELRRLSIRTDKIVGVRREEADALIKAGRCLPRICPRRTLGPAAGHDRAVRKSEGHRPSHRTMKKPHVTRGEKMGSLSSCEAPTNTGSVRLPNQLHFY